MVSLQILDKNPKENTTKSSKIFNTKVFKDPQESIKDFLQG